jgi:hypothetical protein
MFQFFASDKNRDLTIEIGICALILLCSVIGCGRVMGTGSNTVGEQEATAVAERDAENRAAIQRIDLSPGNSSGGSRYVYLPQYPGAIYDVGDTASLNLKGQAISIRLAQVSDLAEPGGHSEVYSFRLRFEIENHGGQAVTIAPMELFSGMNNSGLPLSEGGSVEIASAKPFHLASGAVKEVDLACQTRALSQDMRVWIVVGLPLTDGGYVPLGTQGGVFNLALAAAKYPLGTPTPCILAAGFVEETVPKGSVFGAGQRFEKSWVIQNQGSCYWPSGSTWGHFKGESFGVTEELSLDMLPLPGALFTVTLPMTAPMTSGSYQGEWRLSSPSGQLYGRSFSVQIVVTDTAY